MTDELFSIVVNKQLDFCKKTLLKKAKEYCLTEDYDRLAAFKLNWLSTDKKLNCRQVLWGQLVKHLNSIHDMCNYLPIDEDYYKLNLWEEKITDAINYLLILKGLVIENATNKQI